MHLDCIVVRMQNFQDQVRSSSTIAMKRTAAEAGLPTTPHRVRVTVVGPPDRVTGDQMMNFHLDCDSSYTIDMVKRALMHQIYLVSGRTPRISSFQLRQEGQHVAFTQPITCLKTLSPVQFVRTVPDADE